MIDDKSFRGHYLLYRKDGKGMRRPQAPAEAPRQPRFRHPDRASAVAEAARLLPAYPQSAFLILQEVGRVKALDPDAATGCGDDQAFAAVPAETLRRVTASASTIDVVPVKQPDPMAWLVFVRRPDGESDPHVPLQPCATANEAIELIDGMSATFGLAVAEGARERILKHG